MDGLGPPLAAVEDGVEVGDGTRELRVVRENGAGLPARVPGARRVSRGPRFSLGHAAQEARPHQVFGAPRGHGRQAREVADVGPGRTGGRLLGGPSVATTRQGLMAGKVPDEGELPDIWRYHQIVETLGHESDGKMRVRVQV